MVRKSVFDCQLSPVGRQIAIENSVFNYFDLRSSIGIFDCRLSGVRLKYEYSLAIIFLL